MQNRTVFLKYFSLVITLIILLISGLPVFANDNFIITNIVSDDAGKLLLINGKNTSGVDNYKVVKLENPQRVVLDIPNAVLIGTRRSINLANTGITNVRIAQFSADPSIVRVVFTADSKENFKKLSFHKSDNTLIFKINGIEVQKYSAPSVYRDKDTEDNTQDFIKINNEKSAEKKEGEAQLVTETKEKVIDEPEKQEKPLVHLKNSNDQNMVINTIKNVNNHLVLSGIGSISIKEPFVLHHPNRLVIDIPNSSVNSAELLKIYPLNGTDIIRVGQFDPETLRVVVETADPNNYKTIISPDLQSLVITPKDNVNISNLPNSKKECQIQDIKVQKKDNKTTSIILTATQPIIHNIRHLHRPEKVLLELYNVNAPPKALISALQKTNQYLGVDIGFIEKYPMGSSWSFPINYGAKIESKLSIDGKNLEITFIDKIVAPKGRVVIDAGHGGSEPGAKRAGIYEKHITLDIAKKVYKYLSMAGVDVIMTRNDDDTLSLKERTEITNRVNPNVFVSIHVNACENSRVTGLETHWYTPESKGLANNIHSRLTSYVKSPDRGVIKSMFYVIHHVNVPAVLVEVGFMSNDDERCQIMTEERQELTARAVADGIIQYLRFRY
ncbi:MAG: hypothetical protein A2104_08780 [Candidatus Melainabacteria bacterium GWF2_32_7]|nr:MAG: hypothetical protein A2104_08780 [Candidatus Melainabacteria bacterium GWF2_32_7]